MSPSMAVLLRPSEAEQVLASVAVTMEPLARLLSVEVTSMPEVLIVRQVLVVVRRMYPVQMPKILTLGRSLSQAVR